MGWEKRRNSLYYYRKRRQGRRVISEYLGNGELAELVHKASQERRMDALLSREAVRAELERWDAVDRSVNACCDEIETLLMGALLAHGYHTHKGQWRRKRDG